MNDRIMNPITGKIFLKGTTPANEAKVLWNQLKERHPKKGAQFILNWLDGHAEGQAWRKARMPLSAPLPAQRAPQLERCEDGEAAGTLVDMDGMHEMDAQQLATRVRAQIDRTLAEAQDLKALKCGRIEPETVLARVGALERAAAALKGLIWRAALVVVACLALSGCGGSCGPVTGRSDAPVVSSGGCANGQCRIHDGQ